MATVKRERVFKIKYPDCIRRVIFQYDGECRRWFPTFSQITLFMINTYSLQSQNSLLITYQDADGDLVRMSCHQDVIDILERQSMNPVVVQVTFVEERPQPYATSRQFWVPFFLTKFFPGSLLATEVPPPATAVDEHLSLKQLLHKLSSNLERLKTQIQSYQSFPEDGKSAAKIIEVVKELLEMMTIATSVLSLAVKVGQLRQV